MSSTFIIRDGLESDLVTCLALDHTYATEYVWQMNIAQEVGQWQITFRTERLPRIVDAQYSSSEHRLRLSLASEQCFLVAGERDSTDLLGYLTMRHEPNYRIGWIQDLIVHRPYRRGRIASRLLKVAKSWAQEHKVTKLMIETQTRNFPAINFCTTSGLTFCGYNDRYFENGDIAVFFTQSLR